MLEILERITKGEGHMKDLEVLQDLAPKVIKGSLCGLGQTAPNPVLSTLRFYKNEYLRHVEDGQCDALICNALVDVTIDKNLCIDCKLCRKMCPVNAISEDYVVDNSLCTRCNSCIEGCPKDAISRCQRGEGHV